MPVRVAGASSGWFQKVPEGSGRFWKRFRNVPQGSGKFRSRARCKLQAQVPGLGGWFRNKFRGRFRAKFRKVPVLVGGSGASSGARFPRKVREQVPGKVLEDWGLGICVYSGSDSGQSFGRFSRGFTGLERNCCRLQRSGSGLFSAGAQKRVLPAPKQM